MQSSQESASSGDAPAIRNRNSTTPAIRSASAPVSYSTPYVLPSYAPSMSVPTQAVQSSSATASDEKKDEEKSLTDRFKSAIAFALGGDTSSSASNTQAGTVPTNTAASSNNGFSYSAPSGNVLQAGTVIPVMLFSGINTDMTGQVTAQVESDVYDTATGTTLLIPAGSRIIGNYDSGANESGRVNVNFSTIVLPDGGSYSVGNSMVAVDGQGYNGIQGTLHRHVGQKISKGLLNAAFTALSTISVDRVTLGSDTFNNLTSNDVKPTITVDPGYEFNVYITQPIAFQN